MTPTLRQSECLWLSRRFHYPWRALAASVAKASLSSGRPRDHQVANFGVKVELLIGAQKAIGRLMDAIVYEAHPDAAWARLSRQ